jgi:hypothetical protein
MPWQASLTGEPIRSGQQHSILRPRIEVDQSIRERENIISN